MAETKVSWIVCSMDGNVLFDPDKDEAQEFSTEKAAIKRAKEWVGTSEDDEAWVYRLSHVVSRPDVEPTVKAVK